MVAGAAAGAPRRGAVPLLNLGSSDLHFRTEVQPWIDREVFAPLRARGAAIVHSDLKTLPGVDIAADALSEAGLSRLRAVGARAILCCNMLEHVTDRAALAERLAALVPAGGLLVVTVPFSYPYHPDPIDTYYRPDPEDMSRELFPGCAWSARRSSTGRPTRRSCCAGRGCWFATSASWLAYGTARAGPRARACAGCVAPTGSAARCCGGSRGCRSARSRSASTRAWRGSARRPR
ncbi:hypothetical protein [Nannocystis pusilla]|uniref:hypothetical protein n=1 Tax=Nannocystis pusilla TaxID=889268 RepID=UPI003B7E4DD2